MIATVSRKFSVLCVLLCISGWALPAAAFYPLGGIDSFLNLRLQIWDLNQFDNNSDGEVTGNEGLETFVEVGIGGFTDDEVEIIEESMGVWEDVSTSFAQFSDPIEIQDPLPVTSEVAIDFLSYISLEDLTAEPELDILVDGVLGLTVITFAIDDTVVELGGLLPILVSAGTIVDVDIIIDPVAARSPTPGIPPLYSLKGTMVHELGHLLGLGHTPTNNLAIAGDNEIVENAALVLRDGHGERFNAGATPTMFPLAFHTLRNGLRHDGGEDLAPDDISGISWMYPRGDQSEFFPVQQVVRSNTRPGLPSVPLPGGLITAWLDEDNNPDTPRVAVFSTMSGLYVPLEEVPFAGRFSMQHLWKQIEVEGFEGLVTADYVFTLSPLNGTSFSRQAPPLTSSGDFASVLFSAADFFGIASAAIPSEVFNEFGNVFDISNREAGTPMVWNFETGEFVSADTGRTLEEILGARQPMFGDAQETCPLNLLIGLDANLPDTGVPGLKDGAGAPPILGALRGFRDNYLLKSRPGSAVVDAYYTAGPTVCAFLLNHAGVFKAAQTAVLAVNWLMEQWQMMAGLLGFLLVGGILRKLRRRLRVRAGSAAAGALLALAFLAAPSADATLLALSTPELAAASDAIVTGTVQSAQARKVNLTRGSRIYTDITILVEEVAKGAVNKQSSITFTILGGQVDALVVQVPELPTFEEGQEVLLYLQEKGGTFGYAVVGGVQGKLLLAQEEETGEKIVIGAGIETMRNVAKDKKEIEKDAAQPEELGPAAVRLEDYLGYLRTIVADQEAAAAQ